MAYTAFARLLAEAAISYCLQCCSFRRSSRAFVPKSGCCVWSSAASTMCTAVVHGALFLEVMERCAAFAYDTVNFST
jgi:hypothetical protein